MVANAEAPDRGAGRQEVPVAILVALALERRYIERALSRSPATAVDVVQSGPGPERAARAATRAIESGADALLSCGLAAGLDRRCRPGTVVVPETLRSIDGRSFDTATPWQHALADTLRADFDVATGGLVTVDRVLCTPTTKKQAAEEFDSVAADMESAGIAAVAAEHGIPFVILRVIADGVDDTLPTDIEAWIHDDGRARIALKSLLTRPTDLRGLILLGRRSRVALRVLQETAARLIVTSALWPPRDRQTEHAGDSV